MDPVTLPGMSAGIPAPFWFVEFFKGIGFFLHMIPMHLWFAGLPLAILALLVGGPQAKRYSRRMFGQMPVFFALGVNFAIVPLLFLQTVYYKSFYTATILTAWLWTAIIPLFLLAYYGMYLCSFSIKEYFSTFDGEDVKKKGKPNPPQATPEKSEKTINPGKYRTVFVGLVAWFCLVVVGVLITHTMTLMGKSEVWDSIWEQTQIGGAVTGLGTHWWNNELWLRLAGMFGLALITTGFWAVFDSHVLVKGTDEKEDAYRKWTISYAARISWIGLIISVSTFSYYFWLLDSNETTKFLFQFPWCLFPMALLFLPLFQSVFLASNRLLRPLFLFGLVLGEAGLLACFVAMRQLIQNAQVGQFLQVELLPVSAQWSPLIAFLVVFAIGASVIGWTIRQISKL